MKNKFTASICEITGLAVFLFAAGNVSAQNTNAYDVAANYASFSGNQGFGYGPWALSTPGGGSYIANDAGTHPHSFGLWNNTANSASTAVRPFDSALPVGGTFSLDFRLENLQDTSETNGFTLQDASGNAVFSFFHMGGDNANGWYTDASGTGVATGFSYNFDSFTHLRFVLNTATTYTLIDDTTTNSFSGTLSGASITQITFFRGNGSSTPPNGQDFKFDTLMITSPTPVPPVFITQPANAWGFVSNTITLGAIASSSEAINYQWYFNNAKINGASATNLVLANVGFLNAGNYFATASNSLGTATSSVAIVTILPFGYTNGFDVAGSYSGGIGGNQGFGFEPWSLGTIGGGDYISGDTPQLFGIWNNTGADATTAVRPFNAPFVNGTFLVQLQNANPLDSGNTNALELQDANGNVLFSFFHSDTNDAWYTDAGGTSPAPGFVFDLGVTHFFAFALNSSTSYTFYDLTTGRKFSGTLSGAPIAQVAFLRGNDVNTPSNGGEDFKFNALTLVTLAGNPPAFVVQPQPNGGLVGSTITLGADVTSSTGAATYQWYFGNTPITGATSTNIVIADAALTNSGSYTLVAANLFGSTTSAVAVVTVYVENNRLIAYEGFNYPGGPAIIDNVSQDGGLGWSGAWTNVSASESYITGGSLVGGVNAPPGYDSLSQGNSYFNYGNSRAGRWLDCTTNSVFAARGYLDGNGNIGAPGKTLYVSFLQQPEVPNAFYECEFHRSDLNDPGRIAGVGNDTATTDVYFRSPNGTFTDMGAGDSSAGSTGNLAVDFYVVRIDFQPGHADNVFVYRNPTSLTEPATATLALTNVGNMSFNGFSLGTFDDNELAVDEIRMGATWSDVLGLPGANNMIRPIRQGGNWTIQFAGNPTFAYRVQRAPSVTGPWTDVGTATPAESGIGTVTDPNPLTGQAFYRTVTP